MPYWDLKRPPGENIAMFSFLAAVIIGVGKHDLKRTSPENINRIWSQNHLSSNLGSIIRPSHPSASYFSSLAHQCIIFPMGVTIEPTPYWFMMVRLAYIVCSGEYLAHNKK